MKTELTKAFSGWKFYITLLLMCTIAACSAFYVISYNESVPLSSSSNPMLGVSTVYAKWIGNEWNMWYSSLYFFVIPLAAVMPHGLSLYNDKKTYYIAQALIREKKHRYYRNKIIAAFISGGVMASLPLLFNIAIVALKFPFRNPDLNYDIYYKIQPFSFGSVLFYKSPWLYLIIRITMVFIYAGLSAMLSISISFFSNNRYVILFAPLLLFLVINFVTPILRIPYELSPIRFLGAGNIYIVKTHIVIGEAVVLFILILILNAVGERKKDVI